MRQLFLLRVMPIRWWMENTKSQLALNWDLVMVLAEGRRQGIKLIIIHYIYNENSDWLSTYNQYKTMCEVDMITADIGLSCRVHSLPSFQAPSNFCKLRGVSSLANCKAISKFVFRMIYVLSNLVSQNSALIIYDIMLNLIQ